MLNRIVVLSVTLAISAAAAADERLRQVIADEGRPAAEAERDQYRNPYETLSFFGIRPDMTVVELFPGGGWYTEILAPYLAEEGRLIAAHWNLDNQDVPDFYRDIYSDWEARVSDRDRYGDIEIMPFEPPDSGELGEPGSADMVLTFRNVHGWKRDGNFTDVLASAHAVLKPGGVLGVVGHRLPEDRAVDPDAYVGYIKQSWVVEQAEANGFGFAGASEVNANPADSADHPEGVWNLPPSLRGPEENHDKYLAIGESDRFTLKFVKQ